jgi:hypothetical protein
MRCGILCPAAHEPEYKVWLQDWYLRLGYERAGRLQLQFEPDELTALYSVLKQLVPCQYILFEKEL